MKINYRKIWENHYGEIPNDENGRTYDVHHIDGNRNNNSLENLIAVSIHDHYHMHYIQGDWGACALIAKRMNLPHEYIKNIQTGCKRPGVGGVPKGTKPWNYGVKKCFTPETIEAMSKKRKGKIHSRKLSEDQVKYIRKCYEEKSIDLPGVNCIQQNGKLLTYEHALSKYFAIEYGVSAPCIKSIILGKTFVN